MSSLALLVMPFCSDPVLESNELHVIVQRIYGNCLTKTCVVLCALLVYVAQGWRPRSELLTHTGFICATYIFVDGSDHVQNSNVKQQRLHDPSGPVKAHNLLSSFFEGCSQSVCCRKFDSLHEWFLGNKVGVSIEVQNKPKIHDDVHGKRKT